MQCNRCGIEHDKKRNPCPKCCTEDSKKYYHLNKERCKEVQERWRREKGVRTRKEYGESQQVIPGGIRSGTEEAKEYHRKVLERRRRKEGIQTRDEYYVQHHQSKVFREEVKLFLKELKKEMSELRKEIRKGEKDRKRKEYQKVYKERLKESGYLRHRKAIRRADERNCKWADKKKIAEFYKAARLLTEHTGVTHTVDHIHPLHHPLVCGLHVETNLQILTMEENTKKNNSFSPIIGICTD